MTRLYTDPGAAGEPLNQGAAWAHNCSMIARAIFLIAGLCLLDTPHATAEPRFGFDATLRIDLHHLGDHRRERFVLDELRVEGPWPGSRTRLVDQTGLGSTHAEIYHGLGGARGRGKRGALLYRFTYCSLFSEWQTVPEAKRRERSFSETVRLPFPVGPVLLVIKTRDRRGKMREVFETAIDPASLEVSRERRRGGLKVHRLHGKGAPERSLDIVILGDGYQAWQMDKYLQDARRFTAVLLATPPFAGLREHLNLWAVESPSRQSGVDEPRKGIYRDTALGMSFNTFGSSRYLMTTENKAVRDVAANAPHDAVYILSNTSRYGGGGVYNLYASFVSDNEYDEYIFVHEFGHSFAGLGDEYFTSSTAYNEMYPRGVEPWEPNITAQTRRGRIKWGKLIAPDTPVPTPATDPRYAARVGLFEGAGYSAKGLYRAAVDCKMFDKGRKPFCPVCMRAVQAAIEAQIR
jgi:hypothetical protein